jgi:predicted Zn-dependent protease
VSVALDIVEGRTTLAAARGYSASVIDALHHDAVALWENGREEAALILLRGLRALDPAEHTTLRLLGLMLTERNAHPEALEYLDVALATRPSDALLRLARARLRLVMGDARGACKDLGIAADTPGSGAGEHARLFLGRLADPGGVGPVS